MLLPPFGSRFDDDDDDDDDIDDDDDDVVVLTYVPMSLSAKTASGFNALVLGCGSVT